MLIGFTVTFVIPTWHRGKGLKECIPSASKMPWVYDLDEDVAESHLFFCSATKNQLSNILKKTRNFPAIAGLCLFYIAALKCDSWEWSKMMCWKWYCLRFYDNANRMKLGVWTGLQKEAPLIQETHSSPNLFIYSLLKTKISEWNGSLCRVWILKFRTVLFSQAVF